MYSSKSEIELWYWLSWNFNKAPDNKLRALILLCLFCMIESISPWQYPTQKNNNKIIPKLPPTFESVTTYFQIEPSNYAFLKEKIKDFVGMFSTVNWETNVYKNNKLQNTPFKSFYNHAGKVKKYKIMNINGVKEQDFIVGSVVISSTTGTCERISGLSS